MWLRDSLPNDLPGLRVLLFGYNTNLLDSHSFQTIEDIASKLRTSIRALTNSQVRRG